MTYKTKRLFAIISSLVFVYSELRLAGSGEFLWFTIEQDWQRTTLVTTHIVAIFITIGFAIYYNSKDVAQK
jgi:hypothetical protein